MIGDAWLVAAWYLVVGLLVGAVYFHGLWWATRRLCGESRIFALIAVVFGRFAVLAGLLTLASFEGALPLLASALGVLAARFVVVRYVRSMPGVAS